MEQPQVQLRWKVSRFADLAAQGYAASLPRVVRR
jgi:hypothetical protein